jgi:tetratricopeptide (TPR) repeat protein
MTCLKPAIGWLLLGLLCLGGVGCLPTERAAGGEEDDPDFLAGLSHKRAGRSLRAVESFERALQRDPGSVAAHFELGLLYYQGVTNYVAALYHFDRVRQLNPQFRYLQTVEQMIRGCKQEFIRDVPMGTITLRMQQDLQRLQRLEQENEELRRQLEQLHGELALRASTGGGAGGQVVRVNQAVTSDSFTVREVRNTAGGSGRIHRVEKGDTVYSIARANGLDTATLLAANPGVDHRRILPGQELRIPAR